MTLIECPFEDHRPASRETVLDDWARVIEWLDQYVKSASGGSAEMPGGGDH